MVLALTAFFKSPTDHFPIDKPNNLTFWSFIPDSGAKIELTTWEKAKTIGISVFAGLEIGMELSFFFATMAIPAAVAFIAALVCITVMKNSYISEEILNRTLASLFIGKKQDLSNTNILRRSLLACIRSKNLERLESLLKIIKIENIEIQEIDTEKNDNGKSLRACALDEIENADQNKKNDSRKILLFLSQNIRLKFHSNDEENDYEGQSRLFGDWRNKREDLPRSFHNPHIS